MVACSVTISISSPPDCLQRLVTTVPRPLMVNTFDRHQNGLSIGRCGVGIPTASKSVENGRHAEGPSIPFHRLQGGPVNYVGLRLGSCTLVNSSRWTNQFEFLSSILSALFRTRRCRVPTCRAKRICSRVCMGPFVAHDRMALSICAAPVIMF
jgi:hypothetical protein